MPLRQTIGISLALLMASAAAVAKTPERSASFLSTPSSNADPEKAENRPGRSRLAHRVAHVRARPRLALHRCGWPRRRYNVASGSADPEPEPTRATEAIEIGQAAWYDLVGRRTSSGERLDVTTATAAHRFLPLGSRAKVTDLDTGHSVIVKINDRGPYRRRFIIDLSPRAADQLGIRHAGVAAVAVEPVAIMPNASATTRPTVAVYRGPSVNVTQ
jgi:rare lipoprotein A